MSEAVFKIDREQFDKMIADVSKNGVDVEEIINNYLHNDAAKIIETSIEGLVPVSNRKKKHAKFSNPFSKQENYNLSVKVMAAKEFNYLVFPNEGLGSSVKNVPENFTGRGLEAVTGELLDEMVARITKTI